MARLRLSRHGEQVLADWGSLASGEDRHRMAEVLESLADGTWRDRWFWQPYPGDRGLREIRPRDGLHVFVREEPDEAAGVSFLDIDTISVSG